MGGAAAANPYAPPTGDIELARPPAEGAFAGALFGPRQILACALFGSLLMGILLLWWNYRAMAKTQLARLTFAVGLPVGLLWFGLGLFLPHRIPAGMVNVVASLQFYGFCNPVQGPAVYRHLAAGGARVPHWIVLGIVLVHSVLVAILNAAIQVATLPGP